MTQEEKAKAYERALAKARDFNFQGYMDEECLYDMFPELRESEDEKVRKEIIDYCHERLNTTYGALPNIETIKRWLAWLEKQKYTQRDVDDAYLKGVTDAKNELEKQGEQKPAESKPKFKVGDFILNGYVTNDGKLEIFKIRNVCSYWYDAESIHDGRLIFITFKQEWFCRLWDITDAKDGDVLAGKIDGDDYILIFKQIKDGWIETYGHYYNAVDRFCVPSQLFCRDYQGILTPATKEQRDLLFQKMKEACYEWDAEKEELNKIEQKPIGCSDMATMLKKAFGSVGKKTWGGIEVKDILTWLEMQDSQKPTTLWHDVSEVPDEMQELLVEWESPDATWHNIAFYDAATKAFRHLKQPINNVTRWAYVNDILSQSVTKKSEQVWSDDDEEELGIAIQHLQLEGQYDSINWLKSLKQRLGGQ